MAAKPGGKLAVTENLRAMKAQRTEELAGQVDPTAEARTRERKLLDGLGVAADDLEWLAVNQAWTLLGHDTCAAWWEDRVKPVAESLGFQPTRELGMRFVELIRAEEMTLPPAQRRSTKELALFVGVSEWAARGRKETRERRSAPHVDLVGRPALEGSWTDEATTETSGAVPPANETAAGPEVEVAPSPVDEAAVPAAASAGRAGGQTPARPVPTDSPAADPIEPSHAGVPAVGGQEQERTEEEGGGHMHVVDRDSSMPPCVVVDGLFGNWQDDITCPSCLAWFISGGRATDTPAAELLAPPSPQQPGQDSPTGTEDAAQPRDDRSETSHHDGAGVSPRGEAPEVPRPSVAPVELEDGERTSLPAPSSSDYLLHLFATLVHRLTGLDAEALGPQLLGEELELLHEHVEDIARFVDRVGRARGRELLHTP